MESENKEVQNFGMPWVKEYGYAQAVKLGRTIWISGQLGHDEKGVLPVGMEAQMKQTYVNINKILAGYGFTSENVVEEVIYALDSNAAFAARKKLGREFYGINTEVARTLVGVVSLVIPNEVVEIKVVARKQRDI